MSEGYQALRTGAAWLDLSSKGRIEAAGRDRARLLHNLSTNHIRGLTPGQGCYAFLLSPQGRIQADLNVLCLEDRFLLDTEPELRERVLQHIKRYIIADDVKLTDVTEVTAEIAVEGPGAAAVLAGLSIPVPGEDYAHLPWGNARVQRLSLTGAPGFRIFLPSGDKAAVVRSLEAAGAVAADSEEARIVRLEHARPRYGEDIGETSLPQETQQMHAIHFNKGCYLGQEIVERIRSRGHVNRLLTGVEIDSATLPAAGTKVLADGKEAGEITSAALSPALGRVVALAYMRPPHTTQGTPLSVDGDSARVR